MWETHFGGLTLLVSSSIKPYAFSKKSAGPNNLNPWQGCLLRTVSYLIAVDRLGRTTSYLCPGYELRPGRGDLRTELPNNSMRCLWTLPVCRRVVSGGHWRPVYWLPITWPDHLLDRDRGSPQTPNSVPTCMHAVCMFECSCVCAFVSGAILNPCLHRWPRTVTATVMWMVCFNTIQ